MVIFWSWLELYYYDQPMPLSNKASIKNAEALQSSLLLPSFIQFLGSDNQDKELEKDNADNNNKQRIHRQRVSTVTWKLFFPTMESISCFPSGKASFIVDVSKCTLSIVLKIAFDIDNLTF